MAGTTLVRALCFLVPATVAGLLLLRRGHQPRLAAAALFATMWNLSALLVLHLPAIHYGWWRFEAQGGLFLGMPVDLYLGWALLWGAIPALAANRAPLAGVALVLVLVDLVLLPRFAPTIQLGDRWLLGEAVGLALCLLPAQLLARWVHDDRRLAGRAVLLVLAYNGLLLGVLPAVILEQTGGSRLSLAERPLWLLLLLLPPLALALVLKLTAVQEFVLRGRGTPAHFDPPKRLVTSGVYAYLANPLELSICLLLLGMGALLSSPWVAAAGLMGLIYSLGLPTWQEDHALAERYGEGWRSYRRAVGRWWPRWRPWVDATQPPARLYLAADCRSCAQLRIWLECRQPEGLQLLAAEDYPDRRLSRLTYEAVDGRYREEGVAAMARALEHVHLGWALVGWTLRLPGLGACLQLLAARGHAAERKQ